MAITDIDISETLEAGAPSITYKGDQRPQQVASAPSLEDSRNEMAWNLFGKPIHELTEEELMIMDEYNQSLMASCGIAGVRQPYFLGKLVKKITKPIKKIFKSPVGKAALLGAGIYGLGGGQFFGHTLPGLARRTTIGPKSIFDFKNILPNISKYAIGTPKTRRKGATSGILGSRGKFSPYRTIGAAMALPFVAPGLTEVDDTIEGFATGDQDFDFDYAQMRKDIGDAVAGGDYTEFTEVLDKYNLTEGQQVPYWDTLAAEGGRIGYDEGGSGKTYEKWLDYRIKTIAKGRLPIPFKEWKKGEIKMAHGGSTNFRGADSNEMLNLGGLEKDYRFDGGFVPIGEYEKKDDVPARLSKNEFVFTADAVRAAGGGNVNKGAQRMYDTMKKLESRVA